jgi:hypothetical protein
VELSFEPVIAPAMILNELLRSLSIDNLLDPTQNRCTLTADTLEALSHCTCFKRDTETMQKVERVFGMDAKGAAVFKEPGDIANRIKTLFRRAGIHCETSSKRRQVNGVKQKAVYTVDFNTTSTQIMTELLKHKYHDRECWRDLKIEAFLRCLALDKVLKYVAVVWEP